MARLYEKCTMCGGSGERPDLDWSKAPNCPGCEGTKFIPVGLTSGQFDLYLKKMEAAIAERDEYARVALAGLSGLGIGTPEKGYLRDGGPGLLADDFRRAQVEFERLRGASHYGS